MVVESVPEFACDSSWSDILYALRKEVPSKKRDPRCKANSKRF